MPPPGPAIGRLRRPVRIADAGYLATIMKSIRTRHAPLHAAIFPKIRSALVVLEGFIRDLCALDGSHGSDERDKAQAYSDRCGYPYLNDS
jgi:hypothetical protein